MHNFVACSTHCRMHEAEALNAVARKALVCVEDVAVNKVAAELAGMDWLDDDAFFAFPKVLEVLQNPLAMLWTRGDSETVVCGGMLSISCAGELAA